jgi:hypothetical protein
MIVAGLFMQNWWCCKDTKLRWNVEGYKWNLRTTCNAILDYSVHILKTWVKKKWWKYLLQSSANKSMQVDLCNSVSSSIVFYFAV